MVIGRCNLRCIKMRLDWLVIEDIVLFRLQFLNVTLSGVLLGKSPGVLRGRQLGVHGRPLFLRLLALKFFSFQGFLSLNLLVQLLLEQLLVILRICQIIIFQILGRSLDR